MKQSVPLNLECQHASDEWLCARDATWGVYRLNSMSSLIDNLDIPARVFCGQHKPRLSYLVNARNVKIRRSM